MERLHRLAASVGRYGEPGHPGGWMAAWGGKTWDTSAPPCRFRWALRWPGHPGGWWRRGWEDVGRVAPPCRFRWALRWGIPADGGGRMRGHGTSAPPCRFRWAGTSRRMVAAGVGRRGAFTALPLPLGRDIPADDGGECREDVERLHRLAASVGRYGEREAPGCRGLVAKRVEHAHASRGHGIRGPPVSIPRMLRQNPLWCPAQGDVRHPTVMLNNK